MYLIIYVYAYMYIFIYTYIKTCHIEKIYVCVNLRQIIRVTCECVSTWICANSHTMTKFWPNLFYTLRRHLGNIFPLQILFTFFSSFRLIQLYSFRICRDFLLVNFSPLFSCPFIQSNQEFRIIHIMFSRSFSSRNNSFFLLIFSFFYFFLPFIFYQISNEIYESHVYTCIKVL